MALCPPTALPPPMPDSQAASDADDDHNDPLLAGANVPAAPAVTDGLVRRPTVPAVGVPASASATATSPAEPQPPQASSMATAAIPPPVSLHSLTSTATTPTFNAVSTAATTTTAAATTTANTTLSSTSPGSTLPTSAPQFPMRVYSFGPSASAPTGQPPVRPKRRQVKNACTNCRTACKKCDDARPCLRCVKYGMVEECVDSPRKTRAKGIKRGPYKKRDGPSSDEPSPPSSVDGAVVPAQAPHGSGMGPPQAATMPVSHMAPMPPGYPPPAYYGQHSAPTADPHAAAAAASAQAAAAFYPGPPYYMPVPFPPPVDDGSQAPMGYSMPHYYPHYVPYGYAPYVLPHPSHPQVGAPYGPYSAAPPQAAYGAPHHAPPVLQPLAPQTPGHHHHAATPGNANGPPVSGSAHLNGGGGAAAAAAGPIDSHA